MKKIYFFLLLLPMFSIGQETMNSTGSELTTEQADEVLAHHNKARADLKIPPLTWSSTVAAYAQEWADLLAATEKCEFRHRQNNRYGENIFMTSGSDTFNPVVASQTWYAEKEKYSYSKVGEGNWRQTGHYTQMIWKNTKELGVGMATCKNGNIIVVANYSPAGNFNGQTPY